MSRIWTSMHLRQALEKLGVSPSNAALIAKGLVLLLLLSILQYIHPRLPEPVDTVPAWTPAILRNRAESAAIADGLSKDASMSNLIFLVLQQRRIHDPVSTTLKSAQGWCAGQVAVVLGEITAWMWVAFVSAKAALKAGVMDRMAAKGSQANDVGHSSTASWVSEWSARCWQGCHCVPMQSCLKRCASASAPIHKPTESTKSVQEQSQAKKQSGNCLDGCMGKRTASKTGSASQKNEASTPTQICISTSGVQGSLDKIGQKLSKVKNEAREIVESTWTEYLSVVFVAKYVFSCVIPVLDAFDQNRLALHSILQCILFPSKAAIQEALSLQAASDLLGNEIEPLRQMVTRLPEMSFTGVKSLMLRLLSLTTCITILPKLLKGSLYVCLGLYVGKRSYPAILRIQKFIRGLGAQGAELISAGLTCLRRGFALGTGMFLVAAATGQEAAQSALNVLIGLLREKLQDQVQPLIKWMQGVREAIKEFITSTQATVEQKLRGAWNTVPAPVRQTLMMAQGEPSVFKDMLADLMARDWSTELTMLVSAAVHQHVGMMLMEPFTSLSVGQIA